MNTITSLIMGVINVLVGWRALREPAEARTQQPPGALVPLHGYEALQQYSPNNATALLQCMRGAMQQIEFAKSQ